MSVPCIFFYEKICKGIDKIVLCAIMQCMLKNKKIQIRLSEELHKFLHQQTENASLFIRNIIREKIEKGFDGDDLSDSIEIRARTPYIYFAELFRVVDGDTMFLDIDLGFFTTVRSKVRLAGVDTPPLDTPEGKEARDFVKEELTNSHLVIETRKKEKYGRYLAYIYYHREYKDFENIIRHGTCINKRLVDLGLGREYHH